MVAALVTSMRLIAGISLGLFVGSIGPARLAQAQERDVAETETEILAPHSAFELGVEGGYTQPFGGLGEGRAIGGVADAGGALGLSFGRRFAPRFGLAIFAQYHESVAGERESGNVNVRGVSTGLIGTYHVRPYSMVDPYLSIGTGYRALFVARHDGLNETLHAVQAARGIFGVDFRVSEDVAVGPLIGADLDVFVSAVPEGGANRSIPDVHPSTFLFAGLGGKFDVGGERVASNYDEPVPAAGPPLRRELAKVAPQPEPEPLPTTGIRIDKSILDACGMATPRAYFEFDSAAVESYDVSTLKLVAECFTRGALAGRSMRVIGHADPRGTDKYNMRLGKFRASSVQEFLVGLGVQAATVETMSHGEAEASGDPGEFAFERRVDIALVD